MSAQSSDLLAAFLWIAGITAVLALAAFLLIRWFVLRIALRVADAAEGTLGSTLAAGPPGRQYRRYAAPAASAEEIGRTLAQLDRLAWLMDRIIPLPIIGGIGLDAVLGLVPGIGDLVSALVSSVIVIKAARLGAPPELLMRLLAIQVIDLLAGAVPVVGDLIDAGYQADRRSVQLIREWLTSSRP